MKIVPKVKKSELMEFVVETITNIVSGRRYKQLNESYSKYLLEDEIASAVDSFFDRRIMSPVEDWGDTGGGYYNDKNYQKMTLKATNTFKYKLSLCQSEREVEDAYNEVVEKAFPGCKITYPYKCDGLIDQELPNGKKMKILFEFKYNLDFRSRLDVARVLIQALCYLKRFEKSSMIIPNILFVGDIDECFILHTNCLQKYLDWEGMDWNAAASNQYRVNRELLMALAEDEKDIHPFVYNIDQNFNFQNVANAIVNLANKTPRLIHITEGNVSSIYEHFADRVLTDKNVSTKQSVAIFVGCLSDSEHYYIHPRMANTLVTPFGHIKINGAEFNAFFEYFSDEHTPSEIRILKGIADRLIEDTDRRKSGDFWTPTPWVNYAHNRLDEVLGDDWRSEYVVWDNCAGTSNLTRDYEFSELYISTLFDEELQMGMQYNREAEHFQFDFLNDYIPSGSELFDDGRCKLPKGLLDAFKEDKKILFLINPPYATSTNFGETSKGGASASATNKEMVANGYGKSAQNLYVQFLYRIEKIKRDYDLHNLHIGIFCPTNFVAGTSFKDFRKFFLDDFEYVNGFQFQASHFADVASNWGIGFTIWKSGQSSDKENFEIDICDINKKSGAREIENQGSKTLYNIDSEKTAREWAIEPVKKLKTFDVPNVSSGVTVQDNDKVRGKLFQDALGYFYCNSNNVNKNTQNVGMFSTAFSAANGFGINDDNFYRCMSFYAARKLISANWINFTDEYLAPDESHPDFEEFVNDSIIFSLFEAKSNQSSLREVPYKDKIWEIKNEFFWLSKNQMLKLAEKYNNHKLANDAYASQDRYVYKLLQNIKLSTEAQKVLDLANELVMKSFRYRDMYQQNHTDPNYQVNNWDAGYYQLKNLWKEFFPDEFKEFRNAFNELAEKMRPMVYELGFLKK